LVSLQFRHGSTICATITAYFLIDKWFIGLIELTRLVVVVVVVVVF
jgi:hypothetical protein